MIGRRYGGCIEEGLLDNWKKVWGMIGRRYGG
jgi:hypothetical protein